MVSSLPSLTLLLFVFVAPISCLPFRLYNQRQDGELNIDVQLDNFIIVLVPTSGINWVDITAKTKPLFIPTNQGSGGGSVLQIFSNKTPSAGSTSPYKVDIDKSNVPVDKVSDEPAVEDETTDSQIRESLRSNIVSGGGNIYNNEVTKQSSDAETSTRSGDDNAEKSSSQQESKKKFQENENTEDGARKDSTENKLAFSSTVSAQLDLLTPEKKIPVAAPSPSPPEQEQKNVIFGRVFKNARFLNPSSDEKKVVKMLQSGLEVCSPGQRLTQKGECVDIPGHRESRKGDLAKLLSSLRFGLSPASS